MRLGNGTPIVLAALALGATGVASGCATGSAGGSSTPAGGSSAPAGGSSAPAGGSSAAATGSSTAKTHSSAARVSRRSSGLVASTASSHIVQPQPPAGSCHATGSGDFSEPDPRCTPGAINPAVTQHTIDQTICVPGWSTKVRPSPSITDKEKRASMAAYGDGGPPSDFEYDHLVSLELGGASNDARNLWPEPGASPNPKDAVENTLHRMVCDGQVSLARAQRIIATDWIGWAKRNSSPTRPAPPASSAATAAPVGDVNCSDFPTHAAAQQWFDSHGGSPGNDVAGLDHDHDGLACESLP